MPAAAALTGAVSEAAVPVYAAALISVMVYPVADLASFRELLSATHITCYMMRPGAGVGPASRDKALAMLATGRAVALDADALTSFADAPS